MGHHQVVRAEEARRWAGHPMAPAEPRRVETPHLAALKDEDDLDSRCAVAWWSCVVVPEKRGMNRLERGSPQVRTIP